MATATAREQMFLELVNRARLDPLGEAARFGIDLNAGLATGTISAAPKQVLAFNEFLNTSADAHSQWMLNVDQFNHTGVNGTSPTARMTAAGYTLSGSWRTGENIAWTGSTGAFDGDAAVFAHHQNLFLSSGHRTNIMGDTFKEVGIGSLTGQYGRYNGLMTTQNFAVSGGNSFVTGVTFNDTDTNNFYSIGEGVAARNVQLTVGENASVSLASEAAGGFALGTAQTGAATILFSGAGLASSMGAQFVLTGGNVKIDLVNGNTIQSSVSAMLAGSSVGLTLLGVANISAEGNNLDNVLIGNSGSNALMGGGGNDTLQGGAGNDTAVFDGNVQDYGIRYNASTGIVTVVGDGEGVDRISGVELFQFNTTTYTLADMIAAAQNSPTVSISAPAASVVEGNADYVTMTFNVNLNVAVSSEQTVRYTIAGNGIYAASVADFDGALSGDVVFAAGTTSQTISVRVLGDLISEQNETFSLSLSAPSSGVDIGVASVNATIMNDDIPPRTINGTKKANYLAGGEGVDNINGLKGNDTLMGNGANDVLDGGAGTDVAVYSAASTSYEKTFDAATGKFTIAGADGVDTVSNVEYFAFSDGRLSGNQMRGFADTMFGTKKANVMYGSLGEDNLYGQAGNDRLNGGGGNDRLNGGIGNDVLTGGEGDDTFQFTDGRFGTDWITDFTEADQLQFALGLADDFTDFVITGNDTASVTLAVAGNSVVVQGVGPIHIDADDFLFG